MVQAAQPDASDAAAPATAATVVVGDGATPTPHADAILEIVREAVGHRDIGVHDDFFDLGGDSLGAIRVIAQIREHYGVRVPAMEFFESPTVATLAAIVAAEAAPQRPPVTPRPVDADPVLSYDQQRLWLEDQLLPGAAYHVHGRLRLVGALDVAALEASLREILRRHEVLRSRFPTVEGRTVQVVDDADDGWRLRVVDVTTAADVDDDHATAAARVADDDAAAPFDLEHGPLVRCVLVRLSDAEHVFGVTAHHIVCDDWSVGLFGDELAALYAAGGDAGRAGLADLQIQYQDYAVWQRRWLTGDGLADQLRHWSAHLDGAPVALRLPTRRRRGQAGYPSGRVIRAQLTTRETSEVRDLCRDTGATTFMALLAAYATVLARWSGQRDLVIGVPITGRGDARTQTLIGFFVNTLPVRIDLSGDPTFADVVERARAAIVTAFAHSDAPLELLISHVPMARDPDRTPLFQVILNGVASPQVRPLAGVDAEVLDSPARPSKFDLTLTEREWDGELQLELELNADRYEPAMIEQLVEQLTALMRAGVREPNRAVFGIALGAVSAQPPSAADEQPVADRLASADAHSDGIAVVGTGGRWSHRWLDIASDRVSRAVAGVRAARVSVRWRPDAGLAAAVVGCMRAGVPCAVTPDAAASATGRLDVRIDDEVDATTIELRTSAGVDRDAALPPAADTEDPGAHRPDGGFPAAPPGPGAGERVAVLAASSALLRAALSATVAAGATLFLPDHPLTDDADEALTWLTDHEVDVIYTTGAQLRSLAARPAHLDTLRLAVVDTHGDVIAHDVSALRRLSADCRLVTLYRVGDDGRAAGWYEVPEEWSPADAPLRLPLSGGGDGLRLQHPAGQPAAVGEVAEIWVGSCPTGDLGRRWTHGVVECVGRSGDPRGADLIEAVDVLRRLPAVRDAVVREHTAADGGALLVAYVLCPDEPIDVSTVQSLLATSLPDPVVPRLLVVVDRLPLTPDGDYHTAALPAVEADGPPEVDDGYVAPRTPLEQHVADLLCELLEIDRIGVHDSFFDLGGFSLLATQLSSRLRQSVDAELSLRDIFESATVEILARRIVQAQAERARAEDVEALLDELEADGTEGAASSAGAG